ncbi:aspartyl/asparaginyl beta-hydroxylase domain-containing protein [Pseudonocardia sp. ICBG1293]|uniref:aspartyl/asparaginyl beta-hydroxylase domain-containing protein n=1 Tax=Pseudonocardia sp. ICBG1293 TaxID=2844382 RepID=UPI001CCFD0FB|nr:aspartyl/asparaginyl beta-hydroxylase domain-containing protein [Pseudonocardia sp. ICBG1293]
MTDPLPAFPESAELVARFDELRGEVDRLVGIRDLTPYGDIDPIRAAQVSTGWRLYYAYMLGVANDRAHEDVPLLLDFAERTPRVVNAIVAQLPPGVGLSAHEGPYAGILRYHLPLRVPVDDPPRLRVGQEHHTWAERRPILIDDTFDHEVHNESTGTRIMLIIDVLRPLNPVLDLLNRTCLRLKRRWSAQMIADANGDI